MSFEGGNSGKSTDTDAWMNFSFCNECEEKKRKEENPWLHVATVKNDCRFFPSNLEKAVHPAQAYWRDLGPVVRSPINLILGLRKF